eukprot:3222697-Rhodomonas_salina.1
MTDGRNRGPRVRLISLISEGSPAGAGTRVPGYPGRSTRLLIPRHLDETHTNFESDIETWSQRLWIRVSNKKFLGLKQSGTVTCVFMWSTRVPGGRDTWMGPGYPYPGTWKEFLQ